MEPQKRIFTRYLSPAKELKPILESIEGFIDHQRFKSKRTEGRVGPLSTSADEKAVIRWRTVGRHQEIQEKGLFEVFKPH